MVSGAQGHGRAEGKAGGKDRALKLAIKPFERSAHIFDFCFPVVRALAEADSAKVETQRGPAEVAKDARRVVDDLVMHGAAAERMGMTDQDGAGRADWVGQSVAWIRFSGIEQRFEFSRCAGKEQRS